MLTIRITPKISDSPLARRKRSAPYDTPLNVWTTQKSGRTPSLAQAQHAGGVPADDAVLVLPAEPRRLGLDDRERPLVPHVEAEVGAEHHAVRADRVDQVAKRARVVADDVVAEAAEIGAEGLLRPVFRFRPHALDVKEAAVEVRHGAARVGQAAFELRQPVEDASEHQVRGGDRGVEWVAEEVAEVEGRQPLG